MTKHLRLIMLSLLAMICMGGYSQSDELAVTLDFTNSTNPWNFPKSYQKDGKTNNYTYKGNTITVQAPNGQSCIMFTSDSKHYFLQCHSNGINLTLPQFDFDVTKIVLELYNPSNVTNNIYVNDKDVSTAVNADSKNPVTCTFAIMQDYQKAGNVYTIKNTGTSRIQKIKIYKPTDIRKDAGISFANNTYTVDFAKGKFEGAKLNNPNKLQVSYTILPEKEGTSIDNNGVVTFAKGVEAKYTVTAKFAGNDTYKPATATYTLNVVDNRQDAGIRFAKESYTADIAKGTFNGAELVNPNGLEVAYEITPKTEGVSIAEDGTVTYPAVDATYTVTAKFAGNDTYKPANATYTLNVVDPDVVEFVAGTIKNVDGNTKAITKNGVTLTATNVKFHYPESFRCYSGSTLTFSVKQGIITRIQFEGTDTSFPLNGIAPTNEVGQFKKESNIKLIWDGSVNSIKFKNSASKQARVKKITVTVKLPYTLDESADNVIEAKENAYVTLKRTFFHDNAWNTLCLPFDVDANKVATAFAGAEIREIDISKCKDNTIQFVPATEIKAGVPYIIKWNENVADAQIFEKTFEGVTLVAEPKPVKVNNDITFTGFYKMTAASELGGTSVAAIGAGSKLFTVGEGKMKGFRAAFVLSSNAQASKYKVVIDGTATGIEDLVIDGVKANGRVYNLNGQYVGNNLNGLQPGLYIQNGKKIVVK